MEVMLILVIFFCALSLHFYFLNRKNKNQLKKIMKSSGEDYRLRGYFEITSKWVKNLQSNKSVVAYLNSREVKNVAIYGMGNLGELLYKEIMGSDICIKYAIDKNAKAYQLAIKEIPVIVPEEIASQESVDMIIVTPVFAYSDILKTLEKYNLSTSIISLEDIIFES